MVKPVLHFVGFTGYEIISAYRVWGKPDFIHPYNDPHFRQEYHPGDIVIFANGTESNPVMRNGPALRPQSPKDGV